jgi:hypothetical protein
MRLLFLALALGLAASPALAQFPPPGIYACVDGAGAAMGELSLFVAGDYVFARPDGSSGKGQVASAGTDVNPLSGPLKEMGLTGAFGTDDTGATLFRFNARDGLVVECR